MITKRSSRFIVAIVLLLTVAAGYLATSIVMDNDVKIYFPKDHESYIRTKDLDKTYGSQVMLDVCITTEADSILSAENLEIIQKLTDVFENIPRIQSVSSMTNTEYPEGSSEGMSVYPLVPEDFVPNEQGLKDLKAKLLDWSDAYGAALYSDDFRATQILLRVDDDIHAEEMEKVYDQVLEEIEPYNHAPLSIVVAGDPVLSQVGKKFMYTDLAFLIPFVVVVLFLCLFFSFRNLSATVLPLVTVLVATIWTVATMAVAGVDFTVISSCLPVLIIAVGSAYGIHVINHYLHVKKEKKSSGENSAEILKLAMKEVRGPILLAGFTTLIGFLSILSSPVVPMKAFGAFAGIGTVYSLVLSLFFIPALLTLSEGRKHKNRSNRPENDGHRESSILNFLVGLTQNHRRLTVVSLVVITGLSIFGLFFLNIESSLITYFPYNSQIRKDSRYISETFAGTNTFNIVFTADEGNDLTDPAVLKAMDDLKMHLLTEFPDQVGKIISFSDFIKRMNQVMNYPLEETTANDPIIGGDQLSDETGADSFFSSGDFAADNTGSDSFFGSGDFAEDGTGSDSFFGEDSFFSDIDSGIPSEAPSEMGSEASSVQYPSLEDMLSYRDLMNIFQQSLIASENRNLSATDLMDEVMKQVNFRGAAYYEIPWNPEKYPVAERQELQNLISQYLLLYSGSLDEYANDPLKPTQARMFVQLRTHDTSATEAIIQEVEAFTARSVPEGYSVYNAGIAELELALTDMITSSQLTSLLLALCAVLVVISITYRSIGAGLIGIIPLSFSIIVNFGLMSLLGINLDMVTALIASIAIGIGVDYTVHFLARYKLECAESDDLNEVTRKTIQSTGRGIIINALSVGLGFAVLVFSRFIVLRYIGLLVAVIMLTSSFGALTILPLVLNALKPRFMTSDITRKRD